MKILTTAALLICFTALVAQKKQIQGVFRGSFSIPSGSAASTAGQAFCQDVRGFAPDYHDFSYDFILSSADAASVIIGGTKIDVKKALDEKYIEIEFNGYDEVVFHRGPKSGDQPINIEIDEPMSMASYDPGVAIKDRRIDWAQFGQDGNFDLYEFQDQIWFQEIKQDLLGVDEPFTKAADYHIRTDNSQKFWDHIRKIEKENEYGCGIWGDLCLSNTKRPEISVRVECDYINFKISSSGEMTFTSDTPGRRIKRSVSGEISLDDETGKEVDECFEGICIGKEGIWAYPEDCFVDLEFGSNISVSFEEGGVKRKFSVF